MRAKPGPTQMPGRVNGKGLPTVTVGSPLRLLSRLPGGVQQA